LYFKALFIMSEEKHLENLREIRTMMERSTRFLSLSGLSGVVAGVWAIAGAIVAYFMLENFFGNIGSWKIGLAQLEWQLMGVAVVVFIGALGSAYFFTLRKAKKDNAKIWNKTSRMMLFNLAIPLATGAVVVLFMMYYHLYAFIAPFTLIFYGLSCVNASHTTLTDIRYLGITVILVGLFNLLFLGYGLYFWALGFGVLHIVYGTIMYFKYEK